MLAALNHPNIAAIYGLEKTPDFTALVMELVEGEDLSQRIASGAIPIDEALPIAKQIAEALEAAHEQGIIHRDLKPANIKVKADGTVKVLGFGLAKAVEAGQAGGAGRESLSMSPTLTTPAMTMRGVILGTAAYMSPEQARGKTVDRRADIWAFGVVLYEMLIGRRLFDGDTISDVIATVLTKEPDLSAVPVPWRRLIGRCLEKDPRTRLRDIGDAWWLLDGDDGPVDAAPRARKKRLWSWALGAMVAGAAVTWIAIISSGRTTPPVPVAFVEPPPSGTQFRGAPMPSPDGRRLAWIAVDGRQDARVGARTRRRLGARPRRHRRRDDGVLVTRQPADRVRGAVQGPAHRARRRPRVAHRRGQSG